MSSETKRRERPRHTEVPLHALNQKAAMARLGILSPRKMEELAQACVAEGASEVVVPEGNAYKFGRWYPVELLAAMSKKLAQEKRATLGWYTKEQISHLFGIGEGETKKWIDIIKQTRPDLESEVEGRINRRGIPTEHYTERVIETIREAREKGEVPMKWVREQTKERTNVLPPPESVGDLLETERAAAAVNDERVQAILQSSRNLLQELSGWLEGQSRREVLGLASEVKKITNLLNQYSSAVEFESLENLLSKLIGLQRALERVVGQAKVFGFREEDE